LDRDQRIAQAISPFPLNKPIRRSELVRRRLSPPGEKSPAPNKRVLVTLR